MSVEGPATVNVVDTIGVAGGTDGAGKLSGVSPSVKAMARGKGEGRRGRECKFSIYLELYPKLVCERE